MLTSRGADNPKYKSITPHPEREDISSADQAYSYAKAFAEIFQDGLIQIFLSSQIMIHHRPKSTIEGGPTGHQFDGGGVTTGGCVVIKVYGAASDF